MRLTLDASIRDAMLHPNMLSVLPPPLFLFVEFFGKELAVPPTSRQFTVSIGFYVCCLISGAADFTIAGGSGQREQSTYHTKSY